MRLPRWSMTVMSQRTDHTRLFGTTQSASTSIAWLLRMARSRSLVSSTAASLGRPGSKTGEAIGENSTENCSSPSAARSWYGSTSSAVAVASSRVWPSRNSHVPGTAPNSMWIGRTSSSRRPSTRKPFSSARRMNASSLLLMVSDRGCCMPDGPRVRIARQMDAPDFSRLCRLESPHPLILLLSKYPVR